MLSLKMYRAVDLLSRSGCSSISREEALGHCRPCTLVLALHIPKGGPWALQTLHTGPAPQYHERRLLGTVDPTHWTWPSISREALGHCRPTHWTCSSISREEALGHCRPYTLDGVCSTYLRLDTSTKCLKLLYTSPQPILG